MPNKSTGGYIVILGWALIAFVFFSLAGQWISLHSRDTEFTEYARHVLRTARATQAPISEVRRLLAARARDMSIPLEDARFSVQRQGAFIRTAFDYDLPFMAPVLHRVVYRIPFHHDLTEK